MGLREQIDLLGHKPCYQLRIGGRYVYDVISIERDCSFDQFAASLRITVANPYSFTPDSIHSVELDEGYNNFFIRTFTGYVDDCVVGRFPNTWEIICRDVLKKAVDTWLDDTGVEYNSTQAESAVSDLLARAGLTALDIGTTNFTIGDTNPTKFKLVSIMDAVLQIAALIGWHCWATNDGVVHFHYKKPLPGASVFWTYETQNNIVQYRYTKTDRNLRNKIVVVGYDEIRAEASALSPYVANPPGYRTAILSSEIIDTSSMAQVIANWMLNDLNHLQESVEMDIQANPLLNVGHTITIDLQEDGVSAEYFVFSIRSTNNGDSGEFMMHLTCIGGKSSPIDYVPPGDEGGGGDDGNGQYPTASFSVLQSIVGDPAYLVYVNGSASFSPGGSIVSYAWDWGDSSSETHTDPHATHRYAAAGMVTITLTVTDSNGLTASTSRSVNVGGADSSLAYRILYMAGTYNVYGSPDGGETWYHTTLPSPQSPSALAAAQNTDPEDELDYGIALCGSNENLWRIVGYGQSVSLIYTFTAETGKFITSIAIDPNDSDHWIVTFSNGHVYETTDIGVTWTQVNDLAILLSHYSWISVRDSADWLIPGTGNVWRGGDNVLDTWSDYAPAATVDHLWWGSGMEEMGVVHNGKVGTSADNGATWITGVGVTSAPTCIAGNWIEPNLYVVGGTNKAGMFYTFDAQNFYDTGAFGTMYGTLYTALDATYDPALYGTIWVVG